ncbi:MAG: aspartate aminotransferase family protein [Anaerolineae bacterium]
MDGTRDLTAAEIMALGEAHIIKTYKRAPMVLSHGRGVQTWDTEGREYLDFAAGIAVNALGHADEGIGRVLAEQSAKLIHTSNLYYSQPQIELAQRLTTHSFADRVFFTNSGTEANEAAIKFARKYARVMHNTEAKTQIVCFEHAFHGRTMGSLALTPKTHYQDPFRPLMPDVSVAPFNDMAALDLITERTCAVFIEPIQGEGGIHPATPDFLRALRARCDSVGALLVFDEVQCGLGRTGDLWAYEWAGITPDMMSLAKPLAGGLPIGALLTTEKVAAAMTYGDHGSTFAGSPLITAVANYVFDRIAASEFLKHVRETGAYLKERLEEINSPHIQEVRGRGLMLGVEFTSDLSAAVVEKGYQHGLLLVGAGTNVLRVIPPLVVTPAQCDQFAERLSAILTEV